MGCAHIVPIGTSLLGNFSRDPEGSRVVREYGLEGWERLAPDDERQSRICGLSSELRRYLLEFVEIEGERASAELSSLLRAVSGLGCDPSLTYVILYSTDTCNARLAMDVIAGYLREQGFTVETKVIRWSRSEDELDEAMAELVDKILVDALNLHSKGYLVCINATPGYKIESAYATITAMILGLNCVYYMHEAFKDVIYMPTIPLKPPEDYVKAILELEKPTNIEEARRKLGKTILEELKTRRIITEEQEVVRAKQWAIRIAKLTKEH